MRRRPQACPAPACGSSGHGDYCGSSVSAPVSIHASPRIGPMGSVVVVRGQNKWNPSQPSDAPTGRPTWSLSSFCRLASAEAATASSAAATSSAAADRSSWKSRSTSPYPCSKTSGDYERMPGAAGEGSGRARRGGDLFGCRCQRTGRAHDALTSSYSCVRPSRVSPSLSFTGNAAQICRGGGEGKRMEHAEFRRQPS